MSVENDNREPIEVLYDIEKEVKKQGSNNPLDRIEPRLRAKPGTLKYALLKEIQENGPVTTSELQESYNDGKTRSLTSLYYAFAVDREKNSKGNYVYEITTLGEKVLDTDQTNLSDTNSKAENETKPWHGEDISETLYHALKSIKKQSGCPTTRDANEDFLDMSGKKDNGQSHPTISPYVSQLFKKGLVDRTPVQPYRYWLTEKGKDILKD